MTARLYMYNISHSVQYKGYQLTANQYLDILPRKFKSLSKVLYKIRNVTKLLNQIILASILKRY